MTTKNLINNNRDKKVSVIYPDGKHSHETTVGEVSKRFSSDSKEWRDWFFNNLLTNKKEATTTLGAFYKLL